MSQGGSFLLYDGKDGDEFWTKAETLLYCALIAYIVRVHFSETAKETMEDKIKRLLREEVRKM